MIYQDYTMSPTYCGFILLNYLKVVFLCLLVTKGAQFDWPRILRSEVSTYNIHIVGVVVVVVIVMI